MSTASFILSEMIDKSDDELFILLGEELARIENRNLPLIPERLIVNAKKWLEQFIVRTKRIICENGRVRELAGQEDQIALVSAVAELIAHACIGLPVETISVLLTRIGVNKLCAEPWKPL